MNINNFLFKRVDNSSLIVFRIIFVLLCFLESFGAIATGWVKRTFTFIGFEWLQPLPGYGMYIYYIIMGVFGLFIMLGFKYRFSTILFTIMWLGTYLMQKSSYNNHYYLLIFLSAIMAILPAHRYASIDVKNKPILKDISMPSWCRLIIILQLFIVYTYGSIAKLYPDWLDTTVMTILMKGKQHYYIIGEFLQQNWLHYFLAYGGILFDGLVIPLLLFKPTRKLAFFASIFFHLFNSIVFQVGIFPYLSLAFTLFFFEPKIINRIFLKKKPFFEETNVIIPKNRNILISVFSVYFIIQALLPIRHHLIQDNVLWTEEGHRMSWRMMLRSKQGYVTYYVVDKKTNETTIVNLNDYLTKKQQRPASTKPDVIWQFSQRLKQEYAKKDQDISVFVDCKISVNGRPFQTFINKDIDLAAVDWSAFKHSDWILPSKLD